MKMKLLTLLIACMTLMVPMSSALAGCGSCCGDKSEKSCESCDSGAEHSHEEGEHE